MRKYTNPEAAGYLMEAKACDKLGKELRRVVEKFKRTVDKEAALRQSELETVLQYTSEREIQDDYGWDIISEAQYDWYIELFREGEVALEQHTPSVTELALNITRRIIADIEADRQEWEFSALSPEQQRAERLRAEQSQKAWKEKIAEIKRRRGIIAASAEDEAIG